MMTCPECKSDQVNTRLRVDEFEWHADRIPHKVEVIRCVVPVRECLFCGLEWTDYQADEVRDRALQKRRRAEDDDITF